MSELSDYLNEVARDRDIIGTRPFARAAGVSFSQAQRILDGSTKPKRETLERLAANLGLSYSKLCRLANLPPEYDPFTLPREFDRLDARQRRTVLAVGWTILEAAEAGSDAPQRDKADAHSNGVLSVDFSRQRVTETAWEPTDDTSRVPHKD